ncbi:MAG: GH25 family lysozyme [Candidatus Saccharibacteria bacterium]|nr:GH25 family lysozyme [Candidatus Saccharibacteria bacterium]
MRRLIFTLLLLVLLVGGGFWFYRGIMSREIHLNNFFVGNYDKGVDVSSYQENVDFEKLEEQGIKFAFIKATEGSGHVDKSFAEKWTAAAETDIKTGAYHYFSYESSGAAQAENFIKTVGDLSGHLPPVIDLELTPEEVENPPEKSVVVRGVKAFVAIIEEEYGVKPIIYSRQDYFKKYLADDFTDYPRWITNVFFPVFIEAGDGWLFWQYNDRGELEGYSGEKYIDLNVLNKGQSLESLLVK